MFNFHIYELYSRGFASRIIFIGKNNLVAFQKKISPVTTSILVIQLRVYLELDLCT